MPLCVSCHTGLHSCWGPFRDWRKDDLRAWQTAQVNHYRALYLPIEDTVWDPEKDDILF